MILKELSLTNFKNIAEAQLSFSDKLNCFLGDNAMGKSNVLDAIYYLSFAKSFTGVTDAQLIRRGESFAFIKAAYRRRDVDEELVVGLGGRRKSFKRGGKEYKRLSQHIGLFPAVLASPADMSLVTGTAEERRRFLDMVISQADARYLDSLIKYNHLLEQRNRLLRDGANDMNLFLAIETAMDLSAAYIYKARRQYIDRLSEIHRRRYAQIAGEAEATSLRYSTPLDRREDHSLAALFDEYRQRDMILKHTSVGVHRDDLEMMINDMPVRRVASQGQAKTFTVALRFAQYEFLARASNMAPLLLLDDVFDKLDARRVEQIMNVVATDNFGQIFITDTNRKHLDEILSRVNAPHGLWSVKDGVFSPTQY
jgi:DNA replication and repair protein RecF